jgi:hypothetical protein
MPLPAPVLPSDNVCCTSVKIAVTDFVALIVTTQAPVPPQAPLQPANVDPTPAVGVSVTTESSK